MDNIGDLKIDDWQCTRETIRERNRYLFRNTLISDVTFVVRRDAKNGEHERVLIPAHKYVLAISSPVFFAMFFGGIPEKGREIELPDCDSESFTEFLRYIYYDEVHVTAGSVLGIMYLAKKYLVPSLIRRCGQFLEERVDSNNVFQTLTQARKFREEELEKRCWFIIDLNTAAALGSQGFLDLDEAALARLLERDTLQVTEYQLFQAVLRWARQKCTNQNLDISGSNLRSVLGSALSNIRFPTMSQTFFAEHVVSQDLLTDREALNIFLYHSAANNKPEIRFPRKPRKGRPMLRCSRYQEAPSPHHWYRPPNYTKGQREENLSFTIAGEHPIYVGGMRIYTRSIGLSDPENQQDHVQLQICEELSGKQLGLVDMECSPNCGGEYNGDGVDVKFSTAVPIKCGERYSVRLIIAFHQSVTANKNAPSKEVVCGRVKFIFDSSFSESHFTEVLFYDPWSTWV